MGDSMGFVSLMDKVYEIFKGYCIETGYQIYEILGEEKANSIKSMVVWVLTVLLAAYNDVVKGAE